MAKYLKVDVAKVNNKLDSKGKPIEGIKLLHLGEANMKYKLVKGQLGKAKLIIEIEINSGVELIDIKDQTMPVVNNKVNYFLIQKGEKNKIPMRYHSNFAKLADSKKSAYLEFRLQLPGKTPGTLGNGEDSKTPGSTTEYNYY